MAFGTFFKHKSDTSNNDIIFGCLIDACVNNGFIERAEETFNKIQDGGWMGISGNTIIYTTMIKAYSQTYQLEKAMKIYDIMINGSVNMQPNIITYNSLIDCCVRC
jgi:pentatricopeptide repeat protein